MVVLLPIQIASQRIPSLRLASYQDLQRQCYTNKTYMSIVVCQEYD